MQEVSLKMSLAFMSLVSINSSSDMRLELPGQKKVCQSMGISYRGSTSGTERASARISESLTLMRSMAVLSLDVRREGVVSLLQWMAKSRHVQRLWALIALDSFLNLAMSGMG